MAVLDLKDELRYLLKVPGGEFVIKVTIGQMITWSLSAQICLGKYQVVVGANNYIW